MTEVTTGPERDDTEVSGADRAEVSSEDAAEVSGEDATADDSAATDESTVTSARRSSAWIAWTVAAALAIVAVVAVVQWRAVTEPAEAVEAAREAAVDYIMVLSNWDGGVGLEETYAGLVGGATDEFAPEVDQVFGNEERERLVASDAVSTGTIEDVLTGQLQEGTVSVVVVVDQFVVTGPSADPIARTERVAMLRMTRDGGTWLVDDLEMLSELQLTEQDAP